MFKKTADLVAVGSPYQHQHPLISTTSASAYQHQHPLISISIRLSAPPQHQHPLISTTSASTYPHHLIRTTSASASDYHLHKVRFCSKYKKICTSAIQIYLKTSLQALKLGLNGADTSEGQIFKQGGSRVSFLVFGIWYHLWFLDPRG